MRKPGQAVGVLAPHQEPRSNCVAGRKPHSYTSNSVSEEQFKFTKIVLKKEWTFQGESILELSLLKFYFPFRPPVLPLFAGKEQQLWCYVRTQNRTTQPILIPEVETFLWS